MAGGLGDYKYRQPSARPDPTEAVKRIGAEVIAQARAWRADAVLRSEQLQAASRLAEHATAAAMAHAEAQEQQRQILDQGWNHALSVLEQIQHAKAEIEAGVVRAEQAAQMAYGAPAFPGSYPSAYPGAVASIPNLYPAGVTELAYLRGQLVAVAAVADAALPAAGGAISGTLTFSTDTPLSLNGYYSITTSNLGAPGHEATGPRFHVNNLVDSRQPFVINSLGQSIMTIQDESLDDLTVSHGLQIRRRPTVLATSGIGSGIQFFCTDTSSLSNDTEVANIQYLVTAVTPGAMTSVLRFRALTAGSNRQVCQMWGDGKIEAVNTTEGGHFQVASTVFVANTQHGAFSASDLAFDGSGSTFTGGAGGTLFAGNMSSAFTGRGIDIQKAGVSLFRVGNTGQVVATISDTANTAPNSPFVMDHVLTSGSPAAGFGTLLTMRTRDSANTAVSGAQIKVEATSVTPASVTSKLTCQHIKTGTVTDGWILDANTNFLVQGALGVGNSVAATTLASPGTVVKRIPVFDQAGNLLGSVPVYNAGSFS